MNVALIENLSQKGRFILGVTDLYNHDEVIQYARKKGIYILKDIPMIDNKPDFDKFTTEQLNEWITWSGILEKFYCNDMRDSCIQFEDLCEDLEEQLDELCIN